MSVERLEGLKYGYAQVRPDTRPAVLERVVADTPNLGRLQFDEPLPDDLLECVAGVLRRRPDLGLYVFGDELDPGLSWLSGFEHVRQLSVSLWHLTSFEPLSGFTQLRSLGLGATTSRRPSLSFLDACPALRQLAIEGHTKDIDVVRELRALRGLTLRSITLPDLRLLTDLPDLRSLDIKLGGTSDLRPLGALQQLEYLELWLIRELTDLSEIRRLSNLRYLLLQALKHVAELPDLSSCRRLERIHLETMKGLTDLRPLRSAPALTDLLLADMPHLRWEHVEVLRNHPSLRRLRIGTGSAKRNADLSQRLGYAEAGEPSAELLAVEAGE
jgi:hypothetical protein